MADKNFNQRNQSQQFNEDWDKERNRSSEENDWSQNRDREQNYGNVNYRSNQNRGINQGYRDVGYSGDSAHGMEGENQGNFNRVNYMPDNDDNRNYGNMQHGSSGMYGSRSGGMDSGGYEGERRTNYGHTGTGRNFGNEEQYRGSTYGNSYGDRYGNESDWSRRHAQQSGSGNWGSDYGRQDWGRGQVNTGYGDQGNYGNRDFGNNYGNAYNDYDQSRTRNRYGGDTSNRGNANQGGVDNDWWDKTKNKVSSWFGRDDDDNRNRERDYSGGFRGKGPSDYRRSQDRIREDICDRLTDDDRIDASHVRVQMEDDAVILSGTVNTREEKRRAEDLVESISGVRNVENRLRVGRSNDMSSHEYTGNTSEAGGIGKESGTTNEIIRNTENDRTSGTEKGKNKNQ
jgi:osmotically-inducible protein OsmY